MEKGFHRTAGLKKCKPMSQQFLYERNTNTLYFFIGIEQGLHIGIECIFPSDTNFAAFIAVSHVKVILHGEVKLEH